MTDQTLADWRDRIAMTDSRIAVLMGGPFDGKGMELSEDKHPEILLPLQDPVVLSFADRGVDQPLQAPRFRLARYRLQLLKGFPSDSRVDLYFFEELSC